MKAKHDFIDTFHNTDCAGRIIHCADANRDLDIPPRHKWKGLDIGFPRLLEDVYNVPREEIRKEADRKRAEERRANMAPRQPRP